MCHVTDSTHVKCIIHTHFSDEGTEAQMISTPAQSRLLIRSELRLTTKLLWEYLVSKPILGACPPPPASGQTYRNRGGGQMLQALSGSLNFRTEPEGRGCLEKAGW